MGYWIGRECWGRGIASAGLALFLQEEATRPLTACVAKLNHASIRVLQKVGFTLVREDAFDLPDGTKLEELVFRL